MSDSALPLSYTPYLPPELVDQILQDSSLSKSDLARCCLINRDFLHSARPLPYAALEILITRADDTACWRLDRGTELLFQTLSETPSLRQCARKASLIADFIDEEEIEVYSGLGYDDCGKAVERALAILPRLETLDVDAHLWSSDHAKKPILARGLQWRDLATDGILLAEDVDGNRRTWSKLRDLKKLRCDIINLDAGDTTPLPDHIEVLDITYPCPWKFTLSLSPQSQLRILRGILSDSKLQHLGYMSKLRHLYLFINYYTSVLSSETLSSLSRLPLLESLSVEYYRPTSLDRSLILALLHRLPPSLRRLDFPRYIPFEALTQSRKNDDNSQFQILGIAQTREQNWNVMGDNEFEECANRLSEICKEKGIVIERIDPREDIFRMFLFPLDLSSQPRPLLTWIVDSCLDEALHSLSFPFSASSILSSHRFALSPLAS